MDGADLTANTAFVLSPKSPENHPIAGGIPGWQTNIEANNTLLEKCMDASFDFLWATINDLS